MKYNTKRISWAVTMAIAACICTADSLTDNGQGIWDASQQSVSVSADDSDSDDIDEEDE